MTMTLKRWGQPTSTPWAMGEEPYKVLARYLSNLGGWCPDEFIAALWGVNMTPVTKLLLGVEEQDEEEANEPA